eukprot:m.506657 g.506657  ORF g.506657 m.506657 type:complete len:270 (-) comp21876_c0_seq2:2593-3402(-)
METVGGLSEEHINAVVKASAQRARVTTVVFDVGGVLANDGLPSAGAETIFRTLDMDVNPETVKRACRTFWDEVKVGNISSEAFYRGVLEKLGHDPERWHEFHTLHMDQFGGLVGERTKQILTLLRRIKSSGYQVGVISNHVTSWLEDIFTRSGYDAVFGAAVLSAESDVSACARLSPLVVVSDAAQCGKPNPKIYKYFLDALRTHTGSTQSDEELAASCVFVDNKKANVDAATALGFGGVHYFAMEQTEADLEALLSTAGVCLDPEDES